MNMKNSLIEWGNLNRKCPCCGADVGAGKAIGDGSRENGVFCSLDCYAKFHFQNMTGCSCSSST